MDLKIPINRGKEILIKSVATTLPTYIMSSFRLPTTITTNLTSTVAQYWWSSNGGQCKMHWVVWNKLCTDKQDGGLGFHTIKAFNTELLAKRLW